MPEYRVTIKPLSPFETPLHSDTLFGHLCWALRYLEGEESLKEFLDKLDEDPSAFLLSNAFPEGYLPCPVLEPWSRSEQEAFQKERFPSMPDYEADGKLKTLRRRRLISEKLFDEIKGNLSMVQLYDALHKDKEETFCKNVEEWHNTISRLSNLVLEGNLFTCGATFYNTDLTIFVRENYFGKERLHKLFEFIGESGYGANASTGRGRFSCRINEKSLPGADNPNATMLLSNTIPSPTDPQDGHYNVFTKFCKAGGSYAVRGEFFKRPVLIIEAGATVMGQPRAYYGRILRNVHNKYNEIVHYGIGLPLPVRITK